MFNMKTYHVSIYRKKDERIRLIYELDTNLKPILFVGAIYFKGFGANDDINESPAIKMIKDEKFKIMDEFNFYMD